MLINALRNISNALKRVFDTLRTALTLKITYCITNFNC